MLVASHRSGSQSELVRKRPFPLDAKTILDLQRTAGNQFVGGLLHPPRRGSPPESEPVEPEGIEHDESQAAPLALEPPGNRLRMFWAILIGASVAAGAFVGLIWKLPALSQPSALGAAFACGAAAWFVSWRVLRRGT
jgi:hypothetical protein